MLGTDAHLQSLRPPCLSPRTDAMYASLQVLGCFLIVHMNLFYSVFMVLAGLVPALYGDATIVLQQIKALFS